MSPPRLPFDPRTTAHRTDDSAIRRLLLGIPLALIALALIVPASPVAGARRVTLGVTIEHRNRDAATFDRFTDQVDNRPRIWTLWSTWGNASTRDFPSGAAAWVAGRGAVPMIFWEPFSGFNSCTYADHRRTANGDYDDYIRTWAQAAKRHGKTIILRWAHEINGAFFPWGIKNQTCADTVTDYKNAWRRIHGIFDQVGADNVKFLWTIAKSSCRGGCNPYKDYYPGSAYVDYVGFSNFNWGAYKNKWTPMVSGISDVMVFFRQFTRKPVIVAENASNTLGGSKPDWIKSGYPAVYNRWPQVKAIVYLNVDLRPDHPDWSLDSPGWSTSAGRSMSHRAYERVANQRRFRGRIP